MNNWKLTKINQGYEMTRVDSLGVSCRKLKWWEKIKYLKFNQKL